MAYNPIFLAAVECCDNVHWDSVVIQTISEVDKSPTEVFLP